MFFVIRVVPELLLPPNGCLAQKQPFLPQSMLSWAHIGLVSSFGWLVGGCGARALSRKTPIFFIYDCLGMFMKLQMPWVLGAKALTDRLSD